EELPIRLAGFSHCFRTEAGSAGQFAKGLYRVHQFSKVEMFAFATPETSEAMHEEMRDIEIEIFTELGIPFRVVDIAAGDLGAPAYRKFDLEAWMPSRGGYGEVTSTSNCTDFQSRRLHIRYRDGENSIKLVHTLNGTAVAVPRAIIAILENYQQEDGSVMIPEVLRPFMGGQEVIRKEKPWTRA
ncbi:MAG: aminoacyl--tRNA ligase-related protein, partial [Bacteroidota bacterium]